MGYGKGLLYWYIFCTHLFNLLVIPVFHDLYNHTRYVYGGLQSQGAGC